MNKFILKNKNIDISLFNKLFIKIRSQSYALKSVSKSKTTSFFSMMKGVYIILLFYIYLYM